MRRGWLASYLQDIRASRHRDSYDSSPFSYPAGCFARPSRCFCPVLPVALLLSRSPGRSLFHRAIGVLRRSSFHGFFLLPPRSPTAGFDTNSAPDLLPLFPQCVRVLLFSSRSMSPSPALCTASLRPFLPRPLPPPLLPALPLPLPHPSFPRPRTLRPVVVFFWSLFPHVELVFLPARRQAPGLLENGENGTGTRMREDEDEAEALSRLKGADVTYGSRPDCTQLFRRAILMPWTPSTNHPFLSLLSS